ncbi:MULTISPECIES: TIGR02452 family protein [Protofrankia]|uniref:TIGR02452 family protein n=1 Tax=Protofrankia TaxID=2994361 RepID=UPI00069A3856|nr:MULTISPECIES: TIGR02452 family protein [Protofrankia]ONH35085.1 TIGR02452 family protein [Protofrankia sp. BMG5.30]
MHTQPARASAVTTVLHRRAGRVLTVAAHHGYRRLILGAWGCGVFGNNPATVATAFATHLHHNPWFDHVVFAVLDHQAGTPTYTAFAQSFP